MKGIPNILLSKLFSLSNSKQKLKGIGNENATGANATRGNVYTIHTNKYIEQVNQQQQT